MGSDPAPFFVSLFLFFYESRWLKSIKNTNYGIARKLAIFLGLNEWLKRIWKSLQWNLSTGTNFGKGKHFTHRDCFSRLSSVYIWGSNSSTYMIKGTPTISTLWDFLIKVALYHQKCFLQPLVQQSFESVEQLPLWYNLLKHLHWMLRQGVDPLGVKNVVVKMINHHVLQFKKYNTNNRDIIQQLLT